MCAQSLVHKIFLVGTLYSRAGI